MNGEPDGKKTPPPLPPRCNDERSISSPPVRASVRTKTKIQVLSAIAIAAIVFLALIGNIGRENEGEKQLEAFETLAPSAVHSITVFDQKAGEDIGTVSDQKHIASFISHLQGMDGWLPSHPQFSVKLLVVLKLKDGKKHEFFMCLTEARDPTMYVYGVSREAGYGTVYLYTTKSTSLKDWFARSGVLKKKRS